MAGQSVQSEMLIYELSLLVSINLYKAQGKVRDLSAQTQLRSKT